MNSILMKAALAAALATVSLSANAAESHIKVYTNVDLSLALLKADGSPLPDMMEMTHIPGDGLAAVRERVRVFTNDETKDIEVNVMHDPMLVIKTGTAPAVPLTVSLNKTPLTVAPKDFLASDIFDGALPGASFIMDLDIAQATKAPLTVAGAYEGIVSIAMKQKTASP
ncbi:TPA: fimbrial protein [Stenotrophomonas maltophilia]|nr:fimbrial protein [Stenotrophomonas maltophilia]HEF1872464.1 fimbrial protein [Stenotrophomonas maltophilia]HEF1892939.1 fimbrial protein [Stenotrophomonas maltophilia]